MDPSDRNTPQGATKEGVMPTEPPSETVALSVHTRGEWWTLYHLPLPGGLRYGQLWLPTPRCPEDLPALARLFELVLNQQRAASVPADPTSAERPVLRMVPRSDELPCQDEVERLAPDAAPSGGSDAE